jgi:hypothetical protein
MWEQLGSEASSDSNSLVGNEERTQASEQGGKLRRHGVILITTTTTGAQAGRP